METVQSQSTSAVITPEYLYVRQKKYEVLLFSFMLLIFGNTFTQHLKILDILNIYQNMAIGALVFYHRKALRNTVSF